MTTFEHSQDYLLDESTMSVSAPDRRTLRLVVGGRGQQSTDEDFFEIAHESSILQRVEERIKSLNLRPQTSSQTLSLPEGVQAFIQIQNSSREFIPAELWSIDKSLTESRLRLLHFAELPDVRTAVESLFPIAARLVARATTAHWRAHRIKVPDPSLGFGPDASIDLSWVSTNRRLLISFLDSNSKAEFVGTDRINHLVLIEGLLDPDDENGWLLEWLLD